MRKEAKTLLRLNFLVFARKAIKELDGTTIGDELYLYYLAMHLQRVADDEIRHLMINMPPRHLKTLLAAVCFSAWMLAHRPETKIMVVTYSEALARQISRAIRTLITSDWYREVFDTRLAKGHASAMHFGTDAGGQVYAASIDGSLTGFGADVIIIDDIHNISEARQPSLLHATVDRFFNEVQSRLNRPNKGHIIAIGHRIHDQDLSASLLHLKDWTSIILPLIATRDEVFKTSAGIWRRRKGDLLRPDDFDMEQVETIRARSVNPSFELFYQQDVDGQALPPITADDFRLFEPSELQNLPCILSVDTGTAQGERSSFSVFQVWAFDNATRRCFLLDQQRERFQFRELGRAIQAAAAHYRPSTIIIENAANGPALLSELSRKLQRRVEGVVPRGSKAARLRRHLEKIFAGRIHLLRGAKFCEPFIQELVGFPHVKHTDQVDAFTQAMDWIDLNGPTAVRPQTDGRAYIAVAGGSNQGGPQPGLSTKPSDKGIMAVSNNSNPWRKRY
jgi:predicted phage terminase large subunit-like protein